MRQEELLNVCREVSELKQRQWKRVIGTHPENASTDRVFFEALLQVTSAHGMSTAATVELLKVYVPRDSGGGLLVRDASAWNENGGRGDTWALVRPGGFLASFGGGPFHAVYEPEYTVRDEHTDGLEDHQYASGGDAPEVELDGEERKRQLDARALGHLRSLSGISYGEDAAYRELLPAGFRNPLTLTGFANGQPGQEVVCVAEPLLQYTGVESVGAWVTKWRDNQGVASNFDILASAAVDCHAGREIIRQLRSWTEQQYRVLRETLLTMAGVWPHLLAGTLTFACAHHKSWIAVEQGTETPYILERENAPIRFALSRILAATTGLHAFRGMTCRFDLSNAGQVSFLGQGGASVRTITEDFWPSPGENREAAERLAEQIAGLGQHRVATMRSSIFDPLQLSALIDPDQQILRKRPELPEEPLFGSAATISTSRPPGGRDEPRLNSTGRRGDALYRTLGGDGNAEAYLSDGLWVAPDGTISDSGR